MCFLPQIGEYDEEPEDPDPTIPGYVNDLTVDIDIDNLLTLFRDKLKYLVVPNYANTIKTYWTQNEILTTESTNICR